MPEIEVPGAPVPKARPRFGNGRVFTPRTTEIAEHRIRETWAAAWGPQQGPLYLEVRVRLTRPLGHLGARGNLLPSAPRWPAKRPDADNYAKTALDALNGVAYADDGQVVALFVAKTYCGAGEVPGWRIGVFTMEAGCGDETADGGRAGAAAEGPPGGRAAPARG